MAKKTTRNHRWLLWILLLGITSYISWYTIKKLQEKQALANAKAAYYKAFGISMPGNYSIHGIDVSSHQNIIYWPLVKGMKVDSIKMGFAFIKATEGLNDADKYFVTNWRSTAQAGITHGAYHFFLATKSGEKQAHNFIKHVTLKVGDLPPVVDVEQLYGVKPAMLRQRLQACLDSLENHYHKKPIIYTYVSFYNDYLGEKFEDYPLWIAHYLEPNKPNITRNWVFWQHNGRGSVNGITTLVDCNVFNGDSLRFKALLVK
jgi:lysozyme